MQALATGADENGELIFDANEVELNAEQVRG
jgi:hypothetical protein